MTQVINFDSFTLLIHKQYINYVLLMRRGNLINHLSFSELSVAKRLQEGGFRLVVGRAGLVTNSGYFPHMSMIVKVKLISSFDISLQNSSKLNQRKI